jgi:hypothetical protein
MLQFRVKTFNERKKIPAGILTCEIIEGVAFEESRAEYITGFRIGFEKHWPFEIELEIDRGKNSISILDFFNTFLNSYTSSVNSIRTDQTGDQIYVKWSGTHRRVKDLSKEELSMKYEEIKSTVADELDTILIELKQKMGLKIF